VCLPMSGRLYSALRRADIRREGAVHMRVGRESGGGWAGVLFVWVCVLRRLVLECDPVTASEILLY